VEAVNVTAVLAHPDDELMCAGTLARLAAHHDVTLATLFVDEREPEWGTCADILGVKALSVAAGDEDDFVWSRRTVRTLEPQLPETDLWITHRAEDANTSHGHIGRTVRTLARKNRSSVWEIDQSLPGGIAPGAPNLYVNITDWQWDRDVAIGCYPSQLARYPGFAEAIKARSSAYGWQIGVTAAECFTVHKAVWA
jgi:LmbE family N-acetylglucosaminyl deacetylase